MTQPCLQFTTADALEHVKKWAEGKHCTSMGWGVLTRWDYQDRPFYTVTVWLYSDNTLIFGTGYNLHVHEDGRVVVISEVTP